MAIAIKSIPTLKGKAASAFVKKTKSAEKKRKSVDFTRQISSANTILKNAGLK